MTFQKSSNAPIQKICDKLSFEAFSKIPPEKQAAIIQSGIHEFAQKPYAEVSTDTITTNAGISKGLLFHYFGSKKNFYLYCISQALECLIVPTPEPDVQDFYSIIFGTMDEKLRLCNAFPDEMHLVNMASREVASEVAMDKNQLLTDYLVKTTAESARLMERAVSTLTLKNPLNKKVNEALRLYIGVINNKYLAAYQTNPDAYFIKAKQIQSEMKDDIDLFLYGICRETKEDNT